MDRWSHVSDDASGVDWGKLLSVMGSSFTPGTIGPPRLTYIINRWRPMVLVRERCRRLLSLWSMGRPGLGLGSKSRSLHRRRRPSHCRLTLRWGLKPSSESSVFLLEAKSPTVAFVSTADSLSLRLKGQIIDLGLCRPYLWLRAWLCPFQWSPRPQPCSPWSVLRAKAEAASSALLNLVRELTIVQHWISTKYWIKHYYN